MPRPILLKFLFIIVLLVELFIPSYHSLHTPCHRAKNPQGVCLLQRKAFPDLRPWNRIHDPHCPSYCTPRFPPSSLWNSGSSKHPKARPSRPRAAADHPISRQLGSNQDIQEERRHQRSSRGREFHTQRLGLRHTLIRRVRRSKLLSEFSYRRRCAE